MKNIVKILFKTGIKLYQLSMIIFHKISLKHVFFHFRQFKPSKMTNPWNIVSIYDLQYFNCPSCNFKNHSKQEIVTHAYECHPESIKFLTKISDDSLNDVIFPWNNLIIKEENF